VIERAEQPVAAPGATADVLVWLRERAWIGGWFLVGRIAVFATALVVGVAGPRGYLANDERTHLFGILAGWDGHWYKRVASGGYLLYPDRQSDPAFFPLYPMLLRGLHALGLNYTAAGLILPNLLLLTALAAFYALSTELLGESAARRATVYVAVFPLGYVFSMSYPESLVLTAMSLAALAALRRRWALAAVCGAIGALARPEGAFIALPLLALAWRDRHRPPPRERGLAFGAALAPFAALASYPLYLAAYLDDLFAWSKAQSQWQRHFSPIGFVHTLTRLPTAFDQSAWVVRDLGALVLYLVLLALARRSGVPWSWIVAGLVVVVLPTFSGAFTSVARFGLLVPGVFWGLARLGRDPRADRAIRIVSLALLVAATATVPLSFP
jgi:hypothetical protein